MRALAILLFFLTTSAATLQAQPASLAGRSATVSTDAVHSTLTSSHKTITAGQQFQVAWDIALDPHWHVYWKNPGDSGLAPAITPQDGFTASPLAFPAPRVISIPPVTNYGFEDRAVLLTTFTAPATLTPGLHNLPVKLTYLYCSDVCMPGEITTVLPLEVALSSHENPDFSAILDLHQTTLPKALPAGANVAATTEGEQIRLSFTPSAFGNVTSAHFIPETEGWLHDSAEQPYTNGTLTLSKDPYQTSNPTSVSGLLLINGMEAYTINVPISAGLASGSPQQHNTPSGATAEAAPPNTQAGDINLGLALFFGFLAGLILNVMPCVLPVLSLKILSLVRHHSSAYRRRHTLAYTFGVLASFWSFAIAIALLQGGGQQLGWGFHLQNPMFVAVLTTIMLAVSLNFFGIFFGRRLPHPPHRKPQPEGIPGRRHCYRYPCRGGGNPLYSAVHGRGDGVRAGPIPGHRTTGVHGDRPRHGLPVPAGRHPSTAPELAAAPRPLDAHL